jgi:flagellar hook assembly protein FlgD
MTLGYAQSAGMIGKEVTANTGNTVTVTGNSTELHYRLAGKAQSVTVGVIDANGRVVKTITEGAQEAGMNKVIWDSSGADRTNYTYQVVATNASGGTVTAET